MDKPIHVGGERSRRFDATKYSIIIQFGINGLFSSRLSFDQRAYNKQQPLSDRTSTRCELYPLGVNFTSKQEKELCVMGEGIGIRPILTHSRVGYYFPVVIIRDALVGIILLKQRTDASVVPQEAKEEGNV